MAYCPHCGAQVETFHTFCGTCGKPLTAVEGPEGDAAGVPAQPAVREMDVLISPSRVLVMSVISYGLYLFYWFYLTWKHHRDHTRTEAYPIWHALTLAVPIYGLFRTYAHVRSFKELMAGAGVASSLSAGLAVTLMIVSNALGWASFRLTYGVAPTQSIIFLGIILDLISIGVVVALLMPIQENLNRYWASLAGDRVVYARVRTGETVLVVIGVLSWFLTLLALVRA